MPSTERTYSPFAPVKVMRPMMRQTWRNLTFLHWRYDPAVIRKTIPQELTVDTFDGSAWVGLAPFVLDGVRPLGLPATPWLSRFPETNVRTYVLGPDGEPGVWFHTLEADRLIGVMAARWWYKLAYRWAAMSVSVGSEMVEYRSQRSSWFGRGSTDIAIRTGGPMVAGDLENFLTARYRLYAVNRGQVLFAEIDHEPWPLRHGTVERLDEDLILNSGVPTPVGEPLVYYSRELEVRVGPVRVCTAKRT